MSKIIGNTTATPMAIPDWEQTNPRMADYIKNKPDFDGLSQKVDNIDEKVGTTSVADQISLAIDDAKVDCYNNDAVVLAEAQKSADAVRVALGAHTEDTNNPHGTTLTQLGVNASATELNYLNGATSNIQTQLNDKVPTTRTVNGKALSDNITLSASDIGAAPAGYGLGEYSKQITDWNEATLNGWYRDPGNASNSPFPGQFVIGFVVNYTTDCVQIAYTRNGYGENSKPDNKIRTYDADAGAWGPWINVGFNAYAPAGFGLGETPPIITDANQATKSGFYRFNGVSCANLPSNWQCVYGTMIVSEGLSFTEQILLAQDVVMKRTKDEGQSDWGEWVDCSPSSFAPSGFGLGGHGSPIVCDVYPTDNLNEIIENGWYHWADTPINAPSSYCIMRVWSGLGAFFVQEVMSGTGNFWRRYTTTGTSGWTEWKDIRPEAFAPAGYGLGAEAHFINDCNEAILNGWYTASDAMNTPEGHTYGWLFVSVRAGGYTRQDYYTCTTSPVHFERYRIDGVWGEWVNISKDQFAPAGYGLGNLIGESGAEVLTTTAEVDNFRQNGWRAYWNPQVPLFSMYTGLSGSLLCYGLIRVDSGAWSQRQTYIPRTYPQYALQRYAEDGGAWGEWEWINPPMVSGVEYRTTERYDNQPVYVKRIGSVQLPASSTRSISYYSGDAYVKATPISVQPIYTASYAAEPVELAGIPTFVEKVWAEADIYGAGVVYFKSNSYTDNDHGYAAGSATVSAIVKYIKEVV